MISTVHHLRATNSAFESDVNATVFAHFIVIFARRAINAIFFCYQLNIIWGEPRTKEHFPYLLFSGTPRSHSARPPIEKAFQD